jgi:hypothetical protein
MNGETTNAIYNKKLEDMTNANKNNEDTQEEYTTYFKNVKRAGKKPATKTITPPMDWFETSKDKTQQRFDTVTSILKQRCIRSAKQDNIYGASNIILPCPDSSVIFHLVEDVVIILKSSI